MLLVHRCPTASWRSTARRWTATRSSSSSRQGPSPVRISSFQNGLFLCSLRLHCSIFCLFYVHVFFHVSCIPWFSCVPSSACSMFMCFSTCHAFHDLHVFQTSKGQMFHVLNVCSSSLFFPNGILCRTLMLHSNWVLIQWFSYPLCLIILFPLFRSFHVPCVPLFNVLYGL